MQASRFLPKLARTRERLAAVFGSLERRVLEAVWRRGEATVAGVREELGNGLAYTTVMTTLDRLYKKGALARRREGRAYVYAPQVPREELERGVAAMLLEGALGRDADDARRMLSCIVDAVSERDHRLLDELSRLVQDRKRRRSDAK
jgi:predicted transcriptional regulator